MGWPYQQKPPLGWPLDYDSGLVPEAGFWPFLEGSGNKVFDLSGNDQHSTSFTGNPIWLAGKFGSAINFDGDDYINKTNFPFITPPLTIVAWINQTSGVGTNFYGICGRGERTLSGTNFTFAIRRQTVDGMLYLRWRDDDTVYGGGESSTFNYGTAGWVQVAGVIDSAFDLTLYRNAQIIGTDGSNAAPTDAQTTLFIGNEESGDPFIGDIGHLMIYNRDLLQSEIALLLRYPFWMFKDPAELILASAGQVAVGTILPQITSAYMRI